MRSIDFTVPRTSGLANVAIEYWTKRLAYMCIISLVDMYVYVQSFQSIYLFP